MILVHPEVRRQGIARAVMYHCLKQSRINKKECIIGLDATPEGKNLYGSLGFKTSFDITRCRIPVNSNIPASPDQKVEKFFHFEKIQDYLLQKGFGDRQRVFRVLTRISSGRCFLVRSGNLVKGFVLGRPGAKLPYIGPLIADEEETAGILLKKTLEIWKAHNHKEVYMDIPSAHLNTFAGKKNSLTESWFLSKAVPVRKFNRMYQSISEDNKDQVFSLLKQDFDSEIKDIADMLDGSEASHEKTVAYMETEKNDLIRYQFAIGGPEFS
jgi:hypothetical protein